MKKILFILFIISGTNGNCQEYKSIVNLYSDYNKGNVKYKSLNAKVTPLYFKDNSTDTLFYKIDIEGKVYLYFKIDSKEIHKDIIKLDNQETLLCSNLNGNIINLDLNISQLQAFKISYLNKKYLCIICGGSGLYKSGSFQEISFYILINMQDFNCVTSIWSRAKTVCSFINIDNDENIDFLQLSNNPDIINGYTLTGHSLSSRTFIPITNPNIKVDIIKTEGGLYKVLKR